jgi:hypothetical protein
MKPRSLTTHALALLLGCASTSMAVGGVAAAADAPAPAGKPTPQAAAQPPRKPTPYASTKVGPFTEKTTIHGKVDADLKGVWLLVAAAEIVPGKFRIFPQLVKIEQGKDGPEFRMLDVRLPPSVYESYQAANTKLLWWEPSAESRALLGKSWASLEKPESKGVQEQIFQHIDFTLASPQKYAVAFDKHTPELDQALAGSRFSLTVAERYLPHNLPPDARVADLMGRTTIYAARSMDKGVVQGNLRIGFVAAGAASPLAYNFGGKFAMYRIASSS